MNTHVLGGAFLPHAPQFFTMPETEDAATVARVRAVAARIGEALAALEPEVWIIVANDHVNQFFLHCTPAFTLHMGGEARGSFAGRDFAYTVASERSLALIRHLQSEGFDPAFTSSAEIDYRLRHPPLAHLGVSKGRSSRSTPTPTSRRSPRWSAATPSARPSPAGLPRSICARWSSQAAGCPIFRARSATPTRTSNSTRRFWSRSASAGSRPCCRSTSNGWTIRAMSNFVAGRSGAGALGERVPDIVQLDPSWHHVYGSLGWFAPHGAAASAPHYPAVRADRVALTRTLHLLSNDPAERTRFVADPRGYAAAAGLAADETAALASLDMERMRALGVHPMVPFLARLQIDHEKTKSAR